MTILIADDNEQNRYQLEILLGANGYQIASAANGAEALAMARQTPPDLIISDILMPVMDGFSLCREWKHDERLRTIPFIFYTATYTDERDREFAINLGAERFLVKPEEPDVFIRTVQEVLRQAQCRQATGAPAPLPAEEEGYLKQYNETLIRKLESKMQELECANRKLEQDLIDRKRAEEIRAGLQAQLIQAQKLESIGTLASGVAHEINNPITAIMGYANLILETVDPKDPAARFATEIGKATQHVSTIVKNLLSFARFDRQEHTPKRLSDIIQDTFSLIQALFRLDQIGLVLDVPGDLPPVDCRGQQIQQVIMNLLTNARDALNEKYPSYNPDKRVIVSARMIASPESRRVDTEGQAPRSWIRLTVEDHGPGIPAALRERIFDPFFTTKPRDKGTGLGLSISHGIIKDHGGVLWCESEPGQWTRFHLEIPLVGHKAVPWE